MARFFSSGTISLGTAILTSEQLETDVTAAILLNSNWTLVETVTNATTSNKVFKCDHAGVDFYVVMTRTLSTGHIKFYCGEGYDAPTDVLSPAMVSVSLGGTQAVDSNGLKTTVPSVDFTTSNVETNSPGSYPTTTGDAVSFWMVAVDDDHMVVKTGTGAGLYIGCFTSLSSVSDPSPLVVASVDSASAGGSGSAAGTIMRAIGVTSPAPAFAFSISGPNFASGAMSTSHIATSGNAAQLIDLHASGKTQVAEVAVLGGISNTSTAGFLRGKYKKVLRVAVTASGVAVGDTYTINGTKWAVFNSNPSGAGAVLVDTGVAP